MRASIAARCSCGEARPQASGRSRGGRSRRCSAQRSGQGLMRPARRSAAAWAAIARDSSSALVEQRAVADVAVDVAAGDVVADDAARALVGGADRLVERADDLDAELLAHGERVQGGLDLAVLGPARAGVDGPALVVADDRAARRGVDAVHAPAHRDAVDHEVVEAPLELRRARSPRRSRPRGGCSARGRPPARGPRRGRRTVRAAAISSPIAAWSSLERARRASPGASRAEPVRSFRRRSVRSSTAWPSEPRFIASGSGSTGCGLEHVLDQPLHRAAGERLQPARGLAVARRQQREHAGVGGRGRAPAAPAAARSRPARGAARAASAPRRAAT